MTALQASTNSAGQPPIWFRTSNQICPPKMWSQWFLNAVFAARGMTKRPVSLSRGIGLHLPLRFALPVQPCHPEIRSAFIPAIGYPISASVTVGLLGPSSVRCTYA